MKMSTQGEVKLDVPEDLTVIEDVALESEVETNTNVAADSNTEHCVESSQSDADEMTDTMSETTPASDRARNLGNGQSKWRSFCENFPNLNHGQWYTHPSFNRYWNHYGQVMSWYQKHLAVSSKLQRRYRSQPSPVSPYQPYTLPYQPYQMYSQYPSFSNNQQQLCGQYYSNSKKKSNKMSKRKRKRMRLAKKRKTATENELYSIESEGEQEDDSETSSTLTKVTETGESNMDYEITDEMLDFFAHSEKHRKEREAQKKLEAELPPEKMRVNIEEVKGQGVERTVEAPKEQPGSRRAAEIKELYGKGAAMIHGMETALQMTYDRNMDIKRPKFWPNMPFKVQFS